MTQTSPKRCTFALEENIKPEDMAVIDDGIAAYNLSHGAEDTYTKLEILLRNAQGAVVGGLMGGTIWGMLSINILWIDEHYRQQGYGREMLREAERIAYARGCRRAHVSTLAFQAPDFYPKQGYIALGVMEDVQGHDITFFHKWLTPE